MNNPFTNKKIGLALGGGAVLGAAHIGVLRALEERSVFIDCISGTSVGAMIAALYAFGHPLEKIEHIAQTVNWMDISRFTLSKLGLISNETMGNIVHEAVGDVRIEDAGIRLAIVATDIENARKVVLTHGDAALAVRASCSVPGIFIPVDVNGAMLVDGGLMENVPVSPLREMGAEFVMAVDLNANRRYRKPEDIIDVLTNAIDIAIDYSSKLQAKNADLVIAPEVTTFNRTATDKVSELIRVGYETAVSKFPPTKKFPR